MYPTVTILLFMLGISASVMRLWLVGVIGGVGLFFLLAIRGREEKYFLMILYILIEFGLVLIQLQEVVYGYTSVFA